MGIQPTNPQPRHFAGFHDRARRMEHGAADVGARRLRVLHVSRLNGVTAIRFEKLRRDRLCATLIVRFVTAAATNVHMQTGSKRIEVQFPAIPSANGLISITNQGVRAWESPRLRPPPRPGNPVAAE